MPYMATTSEIRAWLVGQGEQVNTKGALPARLVAKYNAAHGIDGPRRLPGPDELEDLPPEPFGPTIDVPSDSPQESMAPAGPGPSTVLPGPGPDEPPKHAGREWRQSGPRKRNSKASPKITVGIRGDIDAKVRFALTVPGSIWQARDPLCGGVFVQQIPETADALTDIICDSADLVAFFTGPGGAFMKYLKLGAALMPVGQVIMAHHVYHSVEIAEGEPEQAPQQYAA